MRPSLSACCLSHHGTGKTLFLSVKSLLIKSYLSRRRDVFVFPLALIVINFAVFSLKNAPFRLDRAGLSACLSSIVRGNATSSLSGNQLSSLKDPRSHHLKITASEK